MQNVQAMTLPDVNREIAHVEKLWDEMMNDPEFEGHGGSPGEWMAERLDELATRRAALTPETPDAE